MKLFQINMNLCPDDVPRELYENAFENRVVASFEEICNLMDDYIIIASIIHHNCYELVHYIWTNESGKYTNEFWDALYLSACEYGMYDILKEFRNEGDAVGVSGMDLIIISGDIDCIKLVHDMEVNADYTVYNYYDLFAEACLYGDTECAEFFLDKLEFNEQRQETIDKVFRSASNRCDIPLIEFLINYISYPEELSETYEIVILINIPKFHYLIEPNIKNITKGLLYDDWDLNNYTWSEYLHQIIINHPLIDKIKTLIYENIQHEEIEYDMKFYNDVFDD